MSREKDLTGHSSCPGAPATFRRQFHLPSSPAHLIALACGEPPEGRAGWTLKLLADRLVEWEIVESISPETVRQTLKKTN